MNFISLLVIAKNNYNINIYPVFSNLKTYYQFFSPFTKSFLKRSQIIVWQELFIWNLI